MSTIDTVRALIAAELRRPLDQVTPDSDLFEDLGCDDLDRFSIVMRAEERFGVEIADDDICGVRTAAALADVVARKWARSA